MSGRVRHTSLGLRLAEERPTTYSSQPRISEIAELREPLGAVLDVGCGAGASAGPLYKRGATSVTGIEVDRDFAIEAGERYDEVFHGSAEGELPWPPGSFDTVLCHDVLEHLYDPWSLLERLRGLTRSGGQLHVSVPNARHKAVWWPIVREGTVAYAPSGLLDVTHIRFFTRRDIVASIEAAGFRVDSVSDPPPDTWKRRLAYVVTRGRSAEVLSQWWYVLATAP